MTNIKKNKLSTPEFAPNVCECCGQATEYILPIDRGTTVIVKALAAAISRKGINIIHPTKEMEVPVADWTYARGVRDGVLTSTQIGNFTRARVHGLIARSHDKPGNWLLTSKGARFLRGETVPRFAVVSKSAVGNDERSHKESYFEPEVHVCTVHDFTKKDPMWEGINFDIIDGQVVTINTKSN